MEEFRAITAVTAVNQGPWSRQYSWNCAMKYLYLYLHLTTFCYYNNHAGTTGFPKGAMLTHKNLVVSVCAVNTQLGGDAIRTDDIHISYLPASHIFERLVQVRHSTLVSLIKC